MTADEPAAAQALETDGASLAPARDAEVDGVRESDLTWLRRASGDVRLRPWRLTATRLAAYLAGVRGLARGGPAVEAADPGAALDPDRQPALRPWEFGDTAPSLGDLDPAHVVTEELRARSALAAAISPHLPLDEFAATHVKLQVCVRALLLLAGEDALALEPGRLREWSDGQPPRSDADVDFAESLVTTVAGRADLHAAFGA